MAQSAAAMQRVLDEVCRRIRRRELLPGERLPTVRQLAAELQVDKGTVLRAYAQAVEQGLVGPDSASERPHLIVRSAATRELLDPAIQPCVVITKLDERLIGGMVDAGRLAAILQGVIAALHEAGRACIAVPPSWLDAPPAQRPWAVIVLSRPSAVGIGWLASWASEGTAVAADASELDDARFDRIGHDHEAGGRAVVEALLADGRRRILPVIGAHLPSVPPWLQARQRGTLAALRDAGVTALPLCCYPDVGAPATDPVSFERHARMAAGALIEWIAGAERVDALVALTDGMVPSLSQACRLGGRATHQEVAITGYDNYWHDCPAQRFHPLPPLITVEKNNAERGRRLVGLVLTRIQDHGVTPILELLPPSLMRPAHLVLR